MDGAGRSRGQGGCHQLRSTNQEQENIFVSADLPYMRTCQTCGSPKSVQSNQ